MSARPGLSRLIDTYPELAKICEHVSLASIENELFPVTLVDKDSRIANFLMSNSNPFNIDIKNFCIVNGRFYMVSNDIVAKCINQVYDDILKPSK